MTTEVVITGIGLLTPAGIGARATWESICTGKSTAKAIDHFDPSAFQTRFGCPLPSFVGEDFIEKRLLKTLDPFIQYALVAAQFAIRDAKLDPHMHCDSKRIGVYVGSGLGGITSFERACANLHDKGPRRVSPYFIPSTIINLAAGQIAIAHGLTGPNLSPVSACASGAHAIGEAFRVIQSGHADVMVAGAAEAALTPISLAGFGAMNALSKRNDDPSKASRPFDVERDGFVIGEGAGIVVLERADFAKARGVKPYAKLVGYGASADAFHITTPSAEALGATQAMSLAIEDAAIDASEITHINAHGTSTKLNDRAEIQAIKKAFNDKLDDITLTANKSMIGHLLGAAGSVEIGISALTLKDQCIPPTINLNQIDPECEGIEIINKRKNAKIEYLMSNSFGFGGTNASLVLAKA